ncbi:hypothetical protein glysoja_047246 [Glycine soja]|uniref:Uncharacterized protein n=1 Tax=Glycine soja TaxID=3848 RepID=A0A0B2QN29_GLYSO|nr:hypothetical protein glysoja_047246 [Glycine soja]
MKEQEMLEPTELKSYPNFSDSKHNLLCSELKQLYVAITRTRQRLWICDNTKVYSRPTIVGGANQGSKSLLNSG